MKKSLDHIVIGIVVGIIFPFIALFGYYVFTYRSQTSFSGFIGYFSSLRMIVPVISLACIANLLLFFLFLWTDRSNSARGVIMATFAYALWVIYQKYF
jgi:hypothetical protein